MIGIVDATIHAGNFSLNNFSIEVQRGEYAVLMGQTGCGKTSILEAICGLRKIHSGKIYIQGTDVTNFPPGDRNLGYVPQDLALFPMLTVQKHLEFAMKIRKVASSIIADRTRYMSDVLGIDHLLSRRVQGLSGGESQRVALGRALAFEPSVLLLDEPLSALDEKTREEMQSLLLTIKQTTGVTTLHVTHNAKEAESLADRHFRIENGSIVS